MSAPEPQTCSRCPCAGRPVPGQSSEFMARPAMKKWHTHRACPHRGASRPCRGEALTLATMWTDREHTMLGEGSRTHEAAVRGPTDVRCLERACPQAGSGRVAVRGEEGARRAPRTLLPPLVWHWRGWQAVADPAGLLGGWGATPWGHRPFSVQVPPYPSGLLPSLSHTPAAPARPSQESWGRGSHQPMSLWST